MFILGWIALFIQHMNVGMFFDDYGNASLTYGYEVTDIKGTDFGIKAILEWAKWIYFNWGGRLVYACLFLIPLLKHGIHYFMFIQSVIIILILYVIYRIACKVTDKKVSIQGGIITLILYCLIQLGFHNNGTYWASASVLYIWPLLPMLLAMVYYNYIVECIKNDKKYNKILFYVVEGVLIFFTAMSQEQWGGAFLVFIIFYVIFHHFKDIKKYLKADIYVLIMSIVCYIPMAMAPGNSARLDGYEMSVFEKIQTNFPILLDEFMTTEIEYINKMILLATLFLAIILCYKNKKNLWNKILLVFSILVSAGYFVLMDRKITGIKMEIFCGIFMIDLAATAVTYLVSINKLEFFAVLMAAEASVFCLIFSPYVVRRSYMGYIFIAFIYVTISFIAITEIKIWRTVSAIFVIFAIYTGFNNYCDILEGYFENNYYTEYNVEQCQQWSGEKYIVLYKYPDQYNAYRNMSISDNTKYKGILEHWVKRYYGLDEDVELIWTEPGESIINSMFVSTGNGFYGSETIEGMKIQWVQKKSEIYVYNYYEENKSGSLKLTVSTPNDNEGTLNIKVNDKEYSYHINSDMNEIDIPMELMVGKNKVSIETDVEPLKVENDGRDLRYKLYQAIFVS
jgi:hypothetical protein